MTQEQDTFPSIRNLVESDVGPLRRFTGVLDSMPREKQKWNEGQPDERESTRLSLNFKELEVIEAVDPYQFPIFTIQLTESNRKKSRYGVFGWSLAEILDQQYTADQLDPSSPNFIPPAKRVDLKDCVGKRMGMVLADSSPEEPTGRPNKHMLFDGRATDEAHPRGQDMPTAAWEVYLVEGVGVKGGAGTTPLDAAKELLDGWTLDEFNSGALASDIIKGDIALLQAIGKPVSAPDSFTNTMLASGEFTKDETGVFHKV